MSSSCKDFVYYRKKRIKFTPTYYAEFCKLYNFFTGEDLPEYKDLKSTPEKIRELITRYNDLHMDYGVDFLIKLKSFQPVESICENPNKNVKQIEKSDLVSSVGYNSSGIYFYFDCEMFDPNSSSIFDFGKFSIEMFENKVHVFQKENNTLINRYYHPYVSTDGLLCLGDFKEAYTSFFKSLRFVEAYDIVEGILTRYGIDHDNNGSNSDPHASITNWLGHQCVDCLEVVPYKDTILCSKTSQIICSKCAESQKDEVSNKVYTSSCVGHCEVCDKTRYDIQPFNDKKTCLICRALEAAKNKTKSSSTTSSPKKTPNKTTQKKAAPKKINKISTMPPPHFSDEDLETLDDEIIEL